MDVKRLGQSLDIGSLGYLIHAITQMIINIEINVNTEEIFKSDYSVGLGGLEWS